MKRKCRGHSRSVSNTQALLEGAARSGLRTDWWIVIGRKYWRHDLGIYAAIVFRTCSRNSFKNYLLFNWLLNCFLKRPTSKLLKDVKPKRPSVAQNASTIILIELQGHGSTRLTNSATPEEVTLFRAEARCQQPHSPRISDRSHPGTHVHDKYIQVMVGIISQSCICWLYNTSAYINTISPTNGKRQSANSQTSQAC